MPRDPSSTHPDDEQAKDERDHHIDDPFELEEEDAVSRVARAEGEVLDDDDLDDLFDLEDLDELEDEEEEGEGPDA
jgi:hypothetical protein